MRYLIKIIMIIIVLFSFQLYAQSANDSTKVVNGSLIEFEKISHNFGELVEGDVVSHVFKFKNAGNETLEISKVDGG